MKLFIFLSMVVAVSVAQSSNYLLIEDDKRDIDDIMKDPLSLMGLMYCFIERAPCSVIDEAYKNTIPEVISNSCYLCSNKQKHWWNRFLSQLKGYDFFYNLFQDKYDPSGNYLKILEAAVADY